MGWFFENEESSFDKQMYDENFLANQQKERAINASRLEKAGASYEEIEAAWNQPLKKREGSFYEEFLNNATKQALPETQGFGNYIGPYWSDGKFQNSVAFGQAEVTSVLDYLARFHDSVYAVYKDREHREASDIFFNDIAQTLKSNFAHVAGTSVLYGNYLARQMSNVASEVKTRLQAGDFPGAVVTLASTGFGNIKEASRLTNEKYLRNEWNHIKELYRNNPASVGISTESVNPTNVKVDKPQVQPRTQKDPSSASKDIVPRTQNGSDGVSRVSRKGPQTFEQLRQWDLINRSADVTADTVAAAKNMPRINPSPSLETHHQLPNGKWLLRKKRVAVPNVDAKPVCETPSFQKELEKIKQRLNALGVSYSIKPKKNKINKVHVVGVAERVQPLLKNKKKKKNSSMNLRNLFTKRQ